MQFYELIKYLDCAFVNQSSIFEDLYKKKDCYNLVIGNDKIAGFSCAGGYLSNIIDEETRIFGTFVKDRECYNSFYEVVPFAYRNKIPLPVFTISKIDKNYNPFKEIASRNEAIPLPLTKEDAKKYGFIDVNISYSPEDLPKHFVKSIKTACKEKGPVLNIIPQYLLDMEFLAKDLKIDINNDSYSSWLKRINLDLESFAKNKDNSYPEFSKCVIDTFDENDIVFTTDCSAGDSVLHMSFVLDKKVYHCRDFILDGVQMALPLALGTSLNSPKDVWVIVNKTYFEYEFGCLEVINTYKPNLNIIVYDSNYNGRVTRNIPKGTFSLRKYLSSFENFNVETAKDLRDLEKKLSTVKKIKGPTFLIYSKKRNGGAPPGEAPYSE
jgi:hypothetical protein